MTVALSGCSGDDSPTEPAPSPQASSELSGAAGALCAQARADLTALGDDVELDPSVPDPLLEGLVRPGAAIYARLAEDLRALVDDTDPPASVATYLGWFEVLDAIITARLAVGEPGGPAQSETRALESRFQAASTEQAAAATAAGLDECAFDVTSTIFAS